MNSAATSSTKRALLATGVAIWAAFSATGTVIGTTDLSALQVALVAVSTSALLSLGLSIFVYKGLVGPLEDFSDALQRRSSTLAQESVQSHKETMLLAHTGQAIASSDSEAEVLKLLAKSVQALLPERQNSILLAQPGAKGVCFEIPIGIDSLGEPVELFDTPRCGALTKMTSVQSPSSHDLDACSHLSTSPTEASGFCVVIGADGNTIGVVHSLAAPGDLVSGDVLLIVEHLSATAAAKIIKLRDTSASPQDPETDSLTGLPLRTAISKQMISYANNGADFALALCDLDDFESFSSANGRDISDLIIQQFANTLQGALRPSDTSGRYKGDKFLCVLPGCSATQAEYVMERIREAFVLDLVDSELPRITASFGVAASAEGISPSDLVESADIALLMAKNSGGNRVQSADFTDA